MNCKLLFLCAFILTLNISTSSTHLTTTTQYSNFTHQINAFCNEFFQAVANNIEGNFVNSPINALIPLLMAAYGAAGASRHEFIEKIHVPIDEKFTLKYFRKLMKSLNDMQGIELFLANKIFIKKEFETTSYFRRITQKLIQTKIQKVDFTNITRVLNEINGWCRIETNNKITNIIKEEHLDQAQLVMIGAAYFQGDWKIPFSRDLHNRLFYLSENNSILVPMMCSFNKDYRYGLVLDGVGLYVEIPYKVSNSKKGMSLYIILPFEHHKLNVLIDKLTELDFTYLNWPHRSAYLCVPKFKMNTESNLKNVFYNMGIKEMFKYDADFSKISSSDSLRISSIIQKTSIVVNIEDSEATTVSETTVHSRMPPYEINVDRPFIAAIVFKATGTPLYWMRVNDPRI